MEFGLGFASNSSPVFGVGYRVNEAIVVNEGQQPYPNFVDHLVDQGLVESQTYSLYLNDIDASTGTILFGGVDLDKFSGTLSTFPINPLYDGNYWGFYITLTGMSLTTPGRISSTPISGFSFPLSVVLDSGSTLMSLPTAIVQQIANIMGAEYSEETQFYILPNCNDLSADGSLDFIFSGVQFSVPYSEFVTTTNVVSDSGVLICTLGIMALDTIPFGILGDTFLRSMYVVYDLVISS